jgi:hypothetical protein
MIEIIIYAVVVSTVGVLLGYSIGAIVDNITRSKK